MVAPFIALQYQTGTPQMIRYAGANTSPVGNSFGTADTVLTGAENNTMPSGRVIRFGGLNTYLASTGTNIWRSTDGGTTWTIVYTYTSITQNSNKSGFAVVYLNGVPAACNMWTTQSPSNFINLIYSFDGVTWNTVSGAYENYGGAELGLNDLLVVGNTVYCVTGSRGNVLIGLAGAGTCVFTSLSGYGFSLSPSLCQFNNRIFALYTRGAGATLTLGEVVSQNAVVIASLDTGLSATNINGAGALFVDGANMYAIARGSTGGYRAWQIDSALSVTEITSTVLPTVLTASNSQVGSTRMRPLIDGVTSPGSNPTIYLYYSSTANSPWAVYQWNGNATPITLITQGGSTRNSLPFFNNVTGSYFVSDSVFPSTVGISVQITNRVFTSDGVRLSFVIYGTSAGGAISFRIFVGNSNTEYPTTAGTLTSPTVGSISGGNTNIGLTADNGATTYQVTWAAQTDGFTVNEQFRLVGDVFET